MQIDIAAWKEGVIQALVLLSLTFQVALLMLAEFRRRVDSGAVRFLAWSAYMLADGTAIYVLGHLSAASRSPDHELMAFWAPFLLLHLGGQDNITAYAVEDNRLWLRHLQTLAVQVTAAGYVLFYTSVIVGSQSAGSALLRWAGILMFVVGVVKYAERVWALRCAGSNPVGKNYQGLQHSWDIVFSRNSLEDDILDKRPWDTEDCLLMAHRTLGVPKEMIKGLINEAGYRHASDLREEGRLYKVVEMQLYLMHDVLYTKAEVMHTWYGLCIRMLSPVATTVAFLLFHRHQQHRQQHRVDVAVTYVLLVGALVLEVVSALRGLFSSWVCVLLISHGPHYSLRKTLDYMPAGRPRSWPKAAAWVARHVSGSLGRMVLSVRRLVGAADWARYWSASMGQHNLLQLAARSRVSKRSRMANWMGREVWWNAMAYSSSIPVSPFIQELVVDYILSKGGDLRLFSHNHDINLLPHFDSRGQAELKRWGLYEGMIWSVEEKILVWHIATNIYIYSMMSSSEEHEHEHKHLAEAVQALSNYMLYLLASRPYMLGPTANHNSYIEVCFGLIARGPKDAAATPYSSPEEVARFLKTYGDTDGLSRYLLLCLEQATQDHLVSMLDKGCELGSKIVSEEVQDDAVGTLELLAQVWLETLCYAGQRCSALFHAKRLSDGGELITVAAILVEYFKQGKIETKEQEEAAETRFREKQARAQRRRHKARDSRRGSSSTMLGSDSARLECGASQV